jgi:hypothetical protein
MVKRVLAVVDRLAGCRKLNGAPVELMQIDHDVRPDL